MIFKYANFKNFFYILIILYFNLKIKDFLKVFSFKFNLYIFYQN